VVNAKELHKTPNCLRDSHVSVSLFSDTDLKIIESLKHDPSARPQYDPLRGCLTWDDEYDSGLSSEGHQLLYDLWTARNQIHLDKPFSEMVLGGGYYEELWDSAISAKIQWPGFRRIKLSDKDKELLVKNIEESFSEDTI